MRFHVTFHRQILAHHCSASSHETESMTIVLGGFTKFNVKDTEQSPNGGAYTRVRALHIYGKIRRHAVLLPTSRISKYERRYEMNGPITMKKKTRMVPFRLQPYNKLIHNDNNYSMSESTHKLKCKSRDESIAPRETKVRWDIAAIDINNNLN